MKRLKTAFVFLIALSSCFGNAKTNSNSSDDNDDKDLKTETYSIQWAWGRYISSEDDPYNNYTPINLYFELYIVGTGFNPRRYDFVRLVPGDELTIYFEDYHPCSCPEDEFTCPCNSPRIEDDYDIDSIKMNKEASVSTYSIAIDNDGNKFLKPDENNFAEIHDKEIVFTNDDFNIDTKLIKDYQYTNYDKLDIGTKIYCSYCANEFNSNDLIKPSAFYTFSPR